MKAGMISGGDGVLGAHTALDLLQHANPKAVVSVGRDAEKPRAFTAGLGEGGLRCDGPIDIVGTLRQHSITHRLFDVAALRRTFPAFAFTPLDEGLARAHRQMLEGG